MYSLSSLFTASLTPAISPAHILAVLVPNRSAHRRMAPMTETERKLNTSLLQEVGEWQLTGRLTL